MSNYMATHNCTCPSNNNTVLPDCVSNRTQAAPQARSSQAVVSAPQVHHVDPVKAAFIQTMQQAINGNPEATAAINRKKQEIQQANTALAVESQQQEENHMVQSARTAQARRDQKAADLLANTVGVPKEGNMSGLVRGLPASQQILPTSLEENASVAGQGFDTKGPLMADPVKQLPMPKPFDPRNTEVKDIPPERRTPAVDKLLEHREELRQKETELDKELAKAPPGSQDWIDKTDAKSKMHGDENWDTFNISEELRKDDVAPPPAQN